MGKKNNVGKISLYSAISGLIILEFLLYLGFISNTFWKILATGFEAATVGGLADWFAVSALFKEISIPYFKKHTNIIVKNRKKLSEGAAELVTTKWLSPDVIKIKLEDFKFSNEIIEKYNEPRFKEFLISLIRDILLRITALLDQTDVLDTLKRVLKEQVMGMEITEPIGKLIKKSIQDGKQNQLWDLLISTTKKAINDNETQTTLVNIIEKAIQEYKSKGFTKSAVVWLAKVLKGYDQKVITDVLLSKFNTFLDEVKYNKKHKFRESLDNVVLEFSEKLIKNDASTKSIVDNIKEQFLNNKDIEVFIKRSLTNLKGTISSELEKEDSSLMKILIKNLDLLVEEISSSELTKNKIDEWLRDQICSLIDKHHHRIGGMVVDSMNAFDDKELVNQIKDKVGEDLQFIRLNGAVVGGFAGLLIGFVRFCFLN